ncbi:MAG: branched-chain amino acid ABC transporter permease [Acetobacteraceae bacterium]
MLDYLVSLSVFAGLYGLLALGLNLVWGLGGMVNLGLAGLFAIGAYVSALAELSWHLPLAAAAALALLAAAGAGALLAVVTARLKGDYLAIVTLGFAEVIQLLAANEVWLTNGTDGLAGIPAPGRGQLSSFHFDLAAAGVVWLAIILTAVVLRRLSQAPYGRVLRAIREDETVATVAGKRVLRFKVSAFAVGSGVMGLAGSLYAAYDGYVAPDSFDVLVTLLVVLALTAGGLGSMTGAVLGSVLVVALTEGTRFLGGLLPWLSALQVASLRQAVIGAFLLLLLRIRPEGILPERRRLHRLEAAREADNATT